MQLLNRTPRNFAITCLLITILLMGNSALSQEEARPEGPYLGQQPPADTPQLFAPGLITTGREHSAAWFSADGSEIWFARMFPSEIWYARQIDGVWTEPEVATFSGEWDDLYPVLAPDGNSLFFTSRRPIENDGEALRRGKGRLWRSERRDDSWSAPEYLGDVLNFTERLCCGSVTDDGTMYLATREPRQSPDVYSSELTKSGYGHPEACDSLNSQNPELTPFVAPDESYVIFASFRSGEGMSDLFISFKSAAESWTEPMNLGDQINSRWKDEFPCVSPDGDYLFFNSNRPSDLNRDAIPDGPGNIYWVKADFIEKLRARVLGE